MQKRDNGLKAKFNRKNYEVFLRTRKIDAHENYKKEILKIKSSSKPDLIRQGHDIVNDIMEQNYIHINRFGELEIEALLFGIEIGKFIDNDLNKKLKSILLKSIVNTHLNLQRELECYKNRYNVNLSTWIAINRRASQKWVITMNKLKDKLEEEIIKINKKFKEESKTNTEFIPKKINDSLFIDVDRIKLLKNQDIKDYNFKKLITILEEMNTCYHFNLMYSLTILQRVLLDHIFPIFNSANFSDFYNNLGKSEKELYEKMDQSLRNLANIALHSPISRKEIETPSLIQVDHRKQIDRLIGKILIEIKSKQ